MTGGYEDEVVNLLAEEGARVLPSLIRKFVDPWVDRTVREVLAGRATSAGPTRGGKRVQVRFRLGERVAASCHEMQMLRDASSMDFVPQTVAISRMRRSVEDAVIRPDKIESFMREQIRSHLHGFFGSIPQDVLTRAMDKNKRTSSSTWASAYQSDMRRIAYDLARNLAPTSRVGSSDRVPDALEALVARAAELAASVPHHLFPDSGRKLEHDTAKRKLLKAMKVALLAGVTDQELEEIKNEALVNQIMS